MQNSLYFYIPDNVHKCVQLINAIPNNWHRVNGRLEAGPGHIQEIPILTGTGLCISQFSSIQHIIEGRQLPGNERAKPNVFGILCQHQHPGFIRFDNAGYGAGPGSPLNFVETKRFAMHFVKLGYIGELYFSSHYDDENHGDREECRIHLAPWHEIGSTEIQPPIITLKWSPNLSGQRAELATIEKVCHDFKLKPVHPEILSASNA